MIKRNNQPLGFTHHKWAGDVREIPPRLVFRGSDQALARVPPEQRSADFLLELANRLDRVPPRRPKTRDKLIRRYSLIALHRKRQRRIVILRRLRFVYAYTRCQS